MSYVTVIVMVNDTGTAQFVVNSLQLLHLLSTFSA
jgi:hypothetical protein